MCGIVGYSGKEDSAPIVNMNRVQHHRGPDEDGIVFHKDGLVHLGMKRLSIQDLNGGHQPMYTPDQKYCIVFNGEIFNAPELRKNLEQKGYIFQTNSSDTEVVLLLYRDLGRKCIELLNGMFAFVIHDREKNLLFGSRDPFGIKPFHYSMDTVSFSFASEIKSLLVLPWISDELNNVAISHYLTTQTIPAPFTIYQSIRKLKAAHAFTYDLGTYQFNSWKYWNPQFGNLQLGLNDIKFQLKEKFEQAVERWMLSDVPVASSLSGGIDSSLVTAVASRHTRKLSTFSLGFPDMPELDERPLARLVAERWNTHHHEIPINAQDLIDSIPEMMHALDEPYAGGLPSWFVFQAIHQAGFKVALTGTGGDELFGNYHKWVRYNSLTNLISHLRTAWRYRKANLRDIILYPHGSLHYPYFNDGEKQKYILNKKSMVDTAGTAALIESIWDACPSHSSIDRVAWTDIQIQLPDEFLFMTDRFSMAHSLEARTPFLDKELAEFVYSIPASQRTNATNLKYLLKDSLGELIPAELLNAPKKGFTLPMQDWMRGSLKPQVSELLGERFLKEQNIFNPSIYTKYTKPFLEGTSNPEWQMWTLLCFQLWYINRPAKL